MALTKMEHYLVLTDDIHVTRDFYRDVLGLSEGFRPPMEFPGYWLYLGDTPCIHIGDWNVYTLVATRQGIPVSAPAPGTGPVDHIAFNATDFEGTVQTLESHGVEFCRNAVPAVGLRQLFFEDPNGVKIELNFMSGARAADA